MPQLLWSTLNHARYSTGALINERYKVESEISFGRAAQLLNAFEQPLQRRVVLKVLPIHRTRQETIVRELEWLRKHAIDMKTTPLIGEFALTAYTFMVFQIGGPTLCEAMGDPLLRPLSRRQVKEIALQVIRGVSHIHSFDQFHGCINPTTIEFISGATSSETVYTDDDKFQDIKTLRSTAVRVKYYGAVGDETVYLRQMERYRAPEILLGRNMGPAVDSFAIGCLIAEMLNDGRPLFCNVESGPNYFRERLAILYRVLGPIGEDTGKRIEAEFPGTFEDEDYRDVTCPLDIDFSESTRDFLETTSCLNLLYEEFDDNHILSRLLHFDEHGRWLLDEIINHSFLQNRPY